MYHINIENYARMSKKTLCFTMRSSGREAEAGLTKWTLEWLGDEKKWS